MTRSTTQPPSADERDGKAMTDDELLAACAAKVTDSTKFYNTEIAKQRQLAEDYYLGKPFGTEEDGRSQVVIRDVAEAIDSIMPELMEVFAGADRIVVWEPRTLGEVDAAEQASDYVQWVWETQKPTPGFMILYTWIKDALLNKNGVIKVWWEETEETAPEQYEGLTGAQVLELQDDDDFEVVAVERDGMAEIPPAPGAPPPPPPAGPPGAPPPGAPPGPPGAPPSGPPAAPPMPPAPLAPRVEPTFTVLGRRRVNSGRVRMANVPPDEFFIDRNAVSIDEAPSLGQRSKKTVTELIEMGFDADTVRGLGDGDSDPEFSPERMNRFEGSDNGLAREPADDTVREVWTTEQYIRIDFDGDGYAELRKVIWAGSTVLLNEETDSHPYCDLCPNPLPHRFYGESLADKTMDIQLVKSTIVRQMLDNLYLANNPMKEVLEGAVNIDDLLIARPGGIFRSRVPNAVREVATPFVASQSFPMVEYFDQQRETRTGVLRYNQGLDADSLNKTASGMARMMDAGQRRVRLVARIFAETGIIRAFRRIFELTMKHQSVKRMVRLRDRFVAVDPSSWCHEWDAKVVVGLGTGDKDALFAKLAQLLQSNLAIAQLQGGLAGPLVSATGTYELLAQMIQATGLPLPERFYNKPPPQANTPPPPKPDPAMLKAQAEIQAAQAKAASDAQIAQAKAQSDAQLAAMKAQHEMELARAKAAAQLAHEREKLQLEMQLRRERAALENQLQQEQVRATIALKAAEVAQGVRANPTVGKPDGGEAK